MLNLLSLFRTNPRDRNFKKVKPLIDLANEYFAEYEALSDDELRGKTVEFRERLAAGETIDDLLPEAFAVVKQGCKRLCGQKWEAGGIEVEWQMVPFDVQLCGGIYLHRGNVVEMATGEGKTLVASLPLYLNALAGQGAHLVTVNDYLARRDSEWMGRLYNFLGLSVGCILTDMTPEQRRDAYNSDITYGTNNEFGFDYLRDNMTGHPDHLVQRRYHFAIVDEVDSVLIDEARTPLIISGQVDRTDYRFNTLKPIVADLVSLQNQLVSKFVAEAETLLKEAEADTNTKSADDKKYRAGIRLLQSRQGAPKHKRFVKLSGEGTVQRLIDRVERDYMIDKKMPELQAELYFVVDERQHTIDLTDIGRHTISPNDPDLFLLKDIVTEFAALEGRTDLSAEEKEAIKTKALADQEERSEELHNISQLLRAYVLYEKDVEYVIQENKIIIVDEFTGRLMHGRRWSDGLHQAVEAKEGVELQKETQTLATITLQNYFRMYKKLAGMTGTAETEAAEFAHTYKMNVAVIPTHRKLKRIDGDDLIFRTAREKLNAIVEEVRRLNEIGLPVLVGTTSVEASEVLSRMLQRGKISHSVLNARHHEKEAQIVQGAGQRGAVTIATNMAGRGTDIKLGPGVISCSGDGPYCPGCASNAPAGAKIDKDKPPCGLQIIGSERHESRRIDRQLRGRAGRQGDPGTSVFFVSLEDDLMRLFASERIAGLMARGFEEGQPMSHSIATRAITSAQKKIEGINFEQRKHTLEYDNVMNKQREAIYRVRRQALLNEGNNTELVLDIAGEALSQEWETYAPDNDESQWNVEGFEEFVRRSVPFLDLREVQPPAPGHVEDYLTAVLERIQQAYGRKTEVMGEELLGILARFVILQLIDTYWRDHLLAIDELRKGIGLRSYGQLDPLTEYQREATAMFTDMMGAINKEIFEKVFRTTVMHEPETGLSRIIFLKEEGRQSTLDTVRSAQAQAEHDAQAQAHGEAAESDGIGEQAYREATAENHEPEPGDERADAAEQTGPPARGRAQPRGHAPRPAGPPRTPTLRRATPKVGPNDPCPCGSGKKFKKCHGAS